MSEAKAMQEALGTEPGESLEIKGRAVQIRPLTLDQIADILVIVERLQAKGLVEVTLADGRPSMQFDEGKLFLRGGQDALDLLRTAAQLDSGFVKGLNFLEGAKLFSFVYRVQRDFFLQNQTELLEMLAPLVGDMGALIDKLAVRLAGIIGRLSSQSSATPDTPSSESAATR